MMLMLMLMLMLDADDDGDDDCFKNVANNNVSSSANFVKLM